MSEGVSEEPIPGNGWKTQIVEPNEQCLIFYDPMQVVLLSPDAPEVLETVENGCAYIIGGIVDRTPQKHKSLFFATEHSIQVRLVDENVHFPPEKSGVLLRPAH